MNNQIYIHYGATKFDPHKGFPIKNERCWSKPIGGLWASRKNASFGWKDWCAVEEFRDCDLNNAFEFMLADECHIAVITNKDKLHELPRIPSGTALMYPIDFEECVRRGIDAIELLCYGREYSDITDADLHYSLCGWDCDSIVVLNPNVVVTM